MAADESAPTQIGKIVFTKKHLYGIPADERELLIRMGLAMNDLWFLQTLIVAVRQAEAHSEVAQLARSLHLMTILSLLAGKVFEAMEAYRKFFSSSPVGKRFNETASPEAREARDKLNGLLSDSSVLSHVRNEIAFHYPTVALSPLLDRIDDRYRFALYLGSNDGNTMHMYAAEAIWQSLSQKVSPDNPIAALDRLQDEAVAVIKALNAFTNRFAAMLLEKILGPDFAVEDCPIVALDCTKVSDLRLRPLIWERSK